MKSAQSSWRSGKQGAALAVVMIMVVVVAAVGMGLIRMTESGAVESGKWNTSRQAFWNAEAGLAHARTRALVNQTNGLAFVFPASEPRSWTGSTSRGTYRVQVTEDVFAAEPTYTVLSDGVSMGSASAAVQIVVRQESPFPVGIFGDESLRLQPGGDIESTDTNGATVGSNHDIQIQPSTDLDGAVVVGADEFGNNATLDAGGQTNIVYADHIDPDPLGTTNGPLANAFAAAQTVNNNAAVPQINPATLSLTVNNGQTASVPAGDYYLSSIDIRGGGILDITSGPVNFYLTGPMDMAPGSSMSVVGTNASLFRVFSNSTSPIRIQPDGNYIGLIYAPFASEIRIQPSIDFIGLVWGGDVRIQPVGDMIVDSSLLAYGVLGSTYYILTEGEWRQVGRMW